MSMAVHTNIPTASSELAPQRSERLTRPFARFAQLSSAGGLVLLATTAFAMFWANSSWGDAYHYIFHQLEIMIGLDSGVTALLLQHHGHMTLDLFINDFLMAIFFLLVGLEIKREIVVGELSNVRKAALPIVAAIGGMVGPALIYVGVQVGKSMYTGVPPTAMHGWGVPMATDIAFALGILALLGNRVPNSLRIFLTSLAIADDLGALLVIALFYTSELHLEYLGFAAVVVGGLTLLNVFGFKKATWFLVPGLVLWFFFFLSGVHATIAGVVLAATIPVNPRVDGRRYLKYTRAALEAFERNAGPDTDIKTNSAQRAAVMAVNENGKLMLPLLHRMEHGLHPWVAFLIIPIFALANAGLPVEDGIAQSVANNVGIGIIAGLCLGKPIGILVACLIAVKLRIADLPAGVTWRHVIGAGCLGGIGFTMAIFIANLAFDDMTTLNHAKLGILVASTISAIAGLGILLSCPKHSEPEHHEAGPTVHPDRH